jgi:hypothetical protein
MLRQAKLPSVGFYYVSAICKSCQRIIPLEDDSKLRQRCFTIAIRQWFAALFAEAVSGIIQGS